MGFHRPLMLRRMGMPREEYTTPIVTLTLVLCSLLGGVTILVVGLIVVTGLVNLY